MTKLNNLEILAGEIDALTHLTIEGYDHIVGIHNEEETIVEIARTRGYTELAAFLESIPEFEVNVNF